MGTSFCFRLFLFGIDRLTQGRRAFINCTRDFLLCNPPCCRKVETCEDFQRTLAWGYSYFQGYFFSRPENNDAPGHPSNKLNYLAGPESANRELIDLREVGDRIKAEPFLSYLLLRYLNSSAFPLAAEVHSVPHALSLLGERGVRRWGVSRRDRMGNDKLFSAGKIGCEKYEMACWEALDAEARRLKVPENAIPELYVESIDWARTVLSGAH